MADTKTAAEWAEHIASLIAIDIENGIHMQIAEAIFSQGHHEAIEHIVESLCPYCRDGDEPTQPFGPEVSTWYHRAKSTKHGYDQCLASEIRNIVAGMENGNG